MEQAKSVFFRNTASKRVVLHPCAHMQYETELVGIKIKLMLFDKIKVTQYWEGRVGEGIEEELEERNGG